MKWLPFAVLVIVAAGCRDSSLTSQGTSSALDATTDLEPIEGLSRYTLGEPIAYGNMSVVPIVLSEGTGRQEPNPEGGAPQVEVQARDYITLAEAKKNGWIEIHELQGGGEVPRVEVMNKGEMPILLLAGDLLLGGQQDRVVAKDTVVPPGKTVEVPVFCVEPGRWSGSKRFSAVGSQVPNSVAYEAKFGDQHRVWEKVGRFNKSVSEVPGAPEVQVSSVRGGLFSQQVLSRVERGLATFIPALEKHEKAVGFIVAFNGKAEAAEVFGSPEVFREAVEPLLRGFLADAAVMTEGHAEKVSLADCEAFLRKAMSGHRRQRSVTSTSSEWALESGEYVGVETTAPDASPSAIHAKQGELIRGSYSRQR